MKVTYQNSDICDFFQNRQNDKLLELVHFKYTDWYKNITDSKIWLNFPWTSISLIYPRTALFWAVAWSFSLM